AFADPPTPDSAVDDIVTNPQTGEEVQVLHVIADEQGNNAYVLTSDGYLILTRTEVGNLIYCVPDPEEQDPPPCDVYEVVDVETDPDTGYVVGVDLQLQVADPDPDNPEPIVQELVATDGSAELDDGENSNQETEGDPELVAPVTTTGGRDEVSKGKKGRKGSNAYGVRICFGLLGCINIGKTGSSGRDGETGPTINRTVGAAHGDIDVVTHGTHGIKLGSIGGDGGDGGDSY